MNNEFDRKSGLWDTSWRVRRAGMIAEAIAKELDDERYRDALEFGCGTGLISLSLPRKFRSLTLMDSSAGMLAELSKKKEVLTAGYMKPVLCDLTRSEDPGHFDCIYSSMVMHHIADTQNIINRFYSILNENGKLCIVDLDEEDGTFHKGDMDFQGHNGFSRENMVLYFANAGFADVKIETCYTGEKVVVDEMVRYSLFLISGTRRSETAGNNKQISGV